ncbi:UNVERIFIED_CONTAM: putative ascorbate-specific transmembrane electron transporter 2 [Sesamum angustifolium]|uniref:Ascorbate-specific transmembrane electron transporter 2 n=1 Tax=Sesamum angustifolium TaxID=2727405 RepID=A0AAW2NWL2_9LAMI
MAPKRSSSYVAPAFPFAMLAHLVALAVIALVLVWLLHFREGLAFSSDDKAKIFNVHPLLMLLGFVLISGEGIMAYKTVPTIRKRQKLFHLLLHLTAFVAGVVGVYAVFKFHHDLRFPHMYSLHSWLGISTISLFALQLRDSHF